MMPEPFLRMRSIIKDFPGVRALDDVTLEALSGEVLALVGENGAGKSTLMKVLSGVWPWPEYGGELEIGGRACRFSGTREAEEAGVGIIYQELNLFPELSVAENIFLDRQPRGALGIDWHALYARTQKLLDDLHQSGIRPGQPVRELPVGKQQMVEIIKALSLNARLLVFDEPTSALTESEVGELFRIIRRLREDGVCILYISHKMDEIREIADRVAVLRDGKSIGEAVPVGEISLDEIITRMVGRRIEDMYPTHNAVPGEVLLEVRDLDVAHPDLPHEKKVKGVSFTARAGEILGVAGLMGSGRTEMVQAVFGVDPGGTTGEITVGGERLVRLSPEDSIRRGMALVTEDRKLTGLFPGHSVRENAVISSLERIVSRWGLIDRHAEEALAQATVRDMGVKTSGLETLIGTLSGGNQQKVLIGRALNTRPRILILDEPTRGIDIGAKTEIYRLMNRLVEEGVSIIMVSSELPEILGMSDRILVMHEGEIAAELEKGSATREEIMEYATGKFKMELSK